ncbi:MAG: acetate kinase [bacterium]|nr:acetate kinase [bacterium]
MKILCVNAGSSSLKFQLYEMPEEKVLINGYIEKIGEEDCYWTIKINGEKIRKERPLKDHSEASEVLINELLENKVVSSLDEIKGVGHRVLHGGEKYSDSTIITDSVIKDIESLTKLGPLHHPGNLAGIKGISKKLPNVPMVAVFDTAFHQTMPEVNYIYPVPYDWYKEYGVRKYGFHGTSHKYITSKMKEKLNKENPNLIICHIGSGSSIACIKDGVCFDTTMGITPLDGLMMGTRSGAIDPSIIEYVCKESNRSVSEVTNDLNKKSGFLGICGKADCRDVETLYEQGDAKAILAYEMYTDRVAKYIAEYYLKLNGAVDGIVFTAGVGENGPLFREIVLRKLNPIGIYEDKVMNNKIARFLTEREGKISSDSSSVDVYVLPTDEEIMICKDTYEIVKAQ